MSKWIYKYNSKAIMFSLAIISNQVNAEDIKTFYGLDSARLFANKNSNANYQIQAASFAKKDNAIKYQQLLKKKFTHNVSIKEKDIHNKKVYAVIIGPISSKQNSSNLTTSKINKKPLNSHTQKQVNHTKLVVSNTSSKFKIISKDSLVNWWSSGNWNISIGGGEQFPNGSDTLSINNGSGFPAPYDVDLYSAKRSNSGIFTLSASRSWYKNSLYLPSYSIGGTWQYLVKNNLNGQITQYSDPEFLNYNYKTSVTSNVALAFGKINVLQYHRVLPYITAGIGSSFNKTGSYTEDALDFVTPRDSPGFKNNSKTQLAYLFGTGFDFILSDNLSLSVGYNYLNIGSIATGYGVETWSNSRLSVGSNSVNELLITFNYKLNKNHILS